MLAPGFWDDQERARGVIAEVNAIKGWIEPYDRLTGRVRSLLEMEELLAAEPDDAMAAELERELETLDAEVPALELRALMQGPDDHRDAMLEISAGAGGTEAQDWASMLMRMYTRWAERRGYKVELLDVSEGEEAGIKGAMLEIHGANAYGFLRAEAGVHRLVRISPFDSQSRRHTSFASVFVYPLVDDEIKIEIRDEDIRMDVFRASGRRRAARQQDELGGADHPHPLGDRGELPTGALAVQEQGDRDEDAEAQALPARGR